MASSYTLYWNIVSILDTLTTWFVLYKIPFWIRLIVLILVISIMMAMSVFLHYKLKKQANIELMYVRSAGVFLLVYVLFLLTHITIVDISLFNSLRISRYLTPMYVPLMFLVFIGIEDALNLLNRLFRKKGSGNFIVIGLCTLWLMYPLARICRMVPFYIQAGTGTFNTATWRKSPLMERMRIHPLEGKIYSNAPQAIYILTGTPAQWLPDISTLRESMSSRNNNYLVCSNTYGNKDCNYILQGLAPMFQIEEIATFSDGGIYLFK